MNSTIINPPSYSIGNSKRFTKKSNLIHAPGPASYQISRELAKRSLSFSKSKKHSNGNAIIPGPASYNINSTIGYGSRAIIISRKNISKTNGVPGPTDQELPRNISYSIRSKSSGKIYENFAGTGQNAGNPVKPNSPRATIGRAKRLSIDGWAENPGPGAYEQHWEKIKNPNYSFSHTSRDGLLDSALATSTIDVKSSQNTHRRIGSYKDTPGPGDYSPNCSTYKVLSPRAVIGTGPRDDLLGGKNGPGPGNYTPKVSIFAPRFSFSREQKHRNIKLSLPGPGQYEIPSTIGSVRSSTSLNNTILNS